MVRSLAFVVMCATAAACGAVYGVAPDEVPTPGSEGGADSGGTDAPQAGDTSTSSDAAPREFRPSHISKGDFSLTAPAVTIEVPTKIDTSGGTIASSMQPGASPLPGLVLAESAIWSVDTLIVDAQLTVVGSRPLVIVAAHGVTIRAAIVAHGAGVVPGPGGFPEMLGEGAGGRGNQAGSSYCGGGGAGHGSAGARGGPFAASAGGANGVAVNSEGALRGGSGGGAGGLNVGLSCVRGGGGGGALQISAIGSIQITGPGGGIDVGGGGGEGGCSSSKGGRSSGGGGGAGGLVFLESIGGIQLTVGSAIVASGGGGGGGGDNAVGESGGDGKYPKGAAPGGLGDIGLNGGGGDGGSGGVGGTLQLAPFQGVDGAGSAGGGGGGTGRVFLRTRGVAGLKVGGVVAATRTDDPSF